MWRNSGKDETIIIIVIIVYQYEKDEAVWSDAADALSDKEKEDYLESMINLVEREYSASCRVISENYFLKLYEKAGAINESEQEDIVNNGRGRAFMIASPTERLSVDIIAGKEVESIFNG